MKILVVEDDERISDAIVEYLSDLHYAVEAVYDGQSAWDLLDVFTYDLVLLDVMMPEMDGITLCQKLRKKGVDIPILMMTAKDTLDNKIEGLDAGADDYLVKPFELDELSARIRALLRRGTGSLPPVLTWDKLRLDPSSCEVFYDDALLPLSPKEYKLLEFFLRNGRRVHCVSGIDHSIFEVSRESFGVDRVERERSKIGRAARRRGSRISGRPLDAKGCPRVGENHPASSARVSQRIAQTDRSTERMTDHPPRVDLELATYLVDRSEHHVGIHRHDWACAMARQLDEHGAKMLAKQRRVQLPLQVARHEAVDEQSRRSFSIASVADRELAHRAV